MSNYRFNFPIPTEEEGFIWNRKFITSSSEPLTTETLENVTSEYLPLSGGAMRGTIQLNSGSIVFPDNSIQTIAYTADRDTALLTIGGKTQLIDVIDGGNTTQFGGNV